MSRITYHPSARDQSQKDTYGFCTRDGRRISYQFPDQNATPAEIKLLKHRLMRKGWVLKRFWPRESQKRAFTLRRGRWLILCINRATPSGSCGAPVAVHCEITIFRYKAEARHFTTTPYDMLAMSQQLGDRTEHIEQSRRGSMWVRVYGDFECVL